MRDYIRFITLRHWNDHDAVASGYRGYVIVSWAMIAVTAFSFARCFYLLGQLLCHP